MISDKCNLGGLSVNNVWVSILCALQHLIPKSGVSDYQNLNKGVDLLEYGNEEDRRVATRRE